MAGLGKASRVLTQSHPHKAALRRLACARCGVGFDCGAPGDCWCAAEPYRLPLTAAGRAEDCLCPACLRAEAARFPTPRER